MKKTIRDMLIGSILGDAHIGRTGNNRAFLSFEQSIKKNDYLNHLYNIINSENLAMDEPKTYSRNDDRHNTVNQSLYFRTKSLEEFRPLADMFLDNNDKKIIPSTISEYLTHRTLAFWIMDDGQQVKELLCVQTVTLLKK